LHTWNSFADLTQTTFLHTHHTHTTKAHMLDTKHSNNYTPVNSDQTLEIYPFLQQMLYSRIPTLSVQIYTWRTREPNLQPQVIFHLEYLGKQSSNSCVHTFTYITECLNSSFEIILFTFSVTSYFKLIFFFK